MLKYFLSLAQFSSLNIFPPWHPGSDLPFFLLSASECNLCNQTDWS